MRTVVANPNISPDEKKIIVLIKMADRLDNLQRRGNDLTVNYANKSYELLEMLFNFYYANYGKDTFLTDMFKRYNNLSNKIKKKVEVDASNLRKREGIVYRIGETKPFNGTAIFYNENGKIEKKITYNNNLYYNNFSISWIILFLRKMFYHFIEFSNFMTLKKFFKIFVSLSYCSIMSSYV